MKITTRMINWARFHGTAKMRLKLVRTTTDESYLQRLTHDKNPQIKNEAIYKIGTQTLTSEQLSILKRRIEKNAGVNIGYTESYLYPAIGIAKIIGLSPVQIMRLFEPVAEARGGGFDKTIYSALEFAKKARLTTDMIMDVFEKAIEKHRIVARQNPYDNGYKGLFRDLGSAISKAEELGLTPNKIADLLKAALGENPRGNFYWLGCLLEEAKLDKTLTYEMLMQKLKSSSVKEVYERRKESLVEAILDGEIEEGSTSIVYTSDIILGKIDRAIKKYESDYPDSFDELLQFICSIGLDDCRGEVEKKVKETIKMLVTKKEARLIPFFFDTLSDEESRRKISGLYSKDIETYLIELAPVGISYLTEALNDEVETVRLYAARILGKHKDPNTLPALLTAFEREFLRSPLAAFRGTPYCYLGDSSIGKAIFILAEALSEFACIEAIPRLIELWSWKVPEQRISYVSPEHQVRDYVKEDRIAYYIAKILVNTTDKNLFRIAYEMLPATLKKEIDPIIQKLQNKSGSRE